MTLLSQLRSIAAGLLRRKRVESSMKNEIQFHIDSYADDLVKSGVSRHDAERRARIEFGRVESYKEQCRDARGLRLLDDLRADLRYAIRTLARSPSFSVTAILTLALGIGANTGLFTMINTLLLRPIPVQDPWSLYQLSGYTANRLAWKSFSVREYRDVVAGNEVFDQTIADTQVRAKFQNQRMGGYVVSGNYFRTLGGGTALGRPILPEDAVPSASPVVVLGHAAWQRIFDSDPAIVGKTIELSGSRFAVIGVAVPGFTAIDSLVPDFWAPISAKRLFNGNRDSLQGDERSLRIIGRLRSGVTPAQAQSALASLLPRISESRPKELRLADARLESRATYQSWKHSDLANVVPLVTAFALILLIACTNLSNVLLARALNRQREIGIRLSLGATRARVVRQLLTETAVLSLAAGAVGLAISHWSWTLIRRVIVSSFSMKSAMSIVEITPDYRVFAFAFLLSLATGIVFGLVPALHATRSSLNSTLKAESVFLGSIFRGSRLRDGLVVVQFSLSLVLLIGAGLLLHSVTKFSSVKPGFELAHTINIQMIQETQSTDATLPLRLAERLRSMPGVVSVAHAMREPLRGSLPVARVSTGPGDSGKLDAGYNEVASDYFATVGIAILRGRVFTMQESASDAAVAVISEATAKSFWPGEDPLGKTIAISTPQVASAGRELLLNNTSRTVQVVGVARDVVSAWLWNGVDKTCIYLPAKASQLPYYSLLLRVNGNPRSFLPVFRAKFPSIGPAVEFDMRTMEEVMDFQILPLRLASWGAAALGILGLVLASIGIYGVMAYTVSQRTREIGIRMALGADRKHLLWMNLRDGCRLITVAVGCGSVLAYGFSRALRAMIFGISVSDPVTFVLAPAILSLVGLLAVYFPSRKATLVDPNVALRYE
jgi:predicted permease